MILVFINIIDIQSRPWYILGIGGVKKIIILIDTSSSIGDMTYILQSLKTLISNLL